MLSIIGEKLAARGARIGLGLSAMLALCIFLWPSEKWSFEADKFGAFATALALWLWGELSGVGAPHPHDCQLYDDIFQTIGQDELRFLREQDMGAPFPDKAFAGMEKITFMWAGSAYEFHDARLQKVWDQAFNATKHFVHKTRQHTGPMPSNQDFISVKTHQDHQTGTRSPLAIERAEELNHAAGAALKELEALQRTGRARLKR